MKNEIIVSVCMLTYNHEQFIDEAILGVIQQKTTFKIELIIGEDCSTDRTREICLEYKAKYPDLIHLQLPSKNIGAINNSIAVLTSCRGKYIAFCEGDDYWTDPYKLQKQVDFMEKNEEFSLCYHRVNILEEETSKIIDEKNNISLKDKEYDIIHLARSNFIHTPSVLIRSKCLDFNFLTPKFELIDYSVWMLCAENGKIKYFPEIMGVYRVWRGSEWELKDDKIKAFRFIKVLLPLLSRFYYDKVVFYLLFNQLLDLYKKLCSSYSFNKKEKIDFDNLTKDILDQFKEFQIWWFLYMIHLKKSRVYKFRFFFYLIRKRTLTSIFLIKKCLY